MSLKLLPRQNPEEICRNPLNNSSAKARYSFARSRRFNQSLGK